MAGVRLRPLFNTVPTSPSSNPVDPNAILFFSNFANPGSRRGPRHLHQGNWYPINLYDAREGEMRDNAVPNTNSGNKLYSSCSVNGIMNAVELDVGNLASG